MEERLANSKRGEILKILCTASRLPTADAIRELQAISIALPDPCDEWLPFIIEHSIQTCLVWNNQEMEFLYCHLFRRLDEVKLCRPNGALLTETILQDDTLVRVQLAFYYALFGQQLHADCMQWIADNEARLQFIHLRKIPVPQLDSTYTGATMGPGESEIPPDTRIAAVEPRKSTTCRAITPTALKLPKIPTGADPNADDETVSKNIHY